MPPDYFSWSPDFGASFNTFGQASQPVNNLAGMMSPMSSNFVTPGSPTQLLGRVLAMQPVRPTAS
jgi:hypothetical protein